MRSSVGGEIGEAPPVADEASRFRGSAPIGGHDSARQSVGTTVGKRAPPLRKRNKNCGEAGRRGRRPLQSSIGEWCVGADVGIGLLTALLVMCHCETSSQTGRGERTERCQWQKKRGERVAAVKISSVRRKAAQKFWAPQQGHPHPPSPKKRSCTPVQERFTLYYKLSINPSPYCCPSWANTTSAARKNFSAAWS